MSAHGTRLKIISRPLRILKLIYSKIQSDFTLNIIPYLYKHSTIEIAFTIKTVPSLITSTAFNELNSREKKSFNGRDIMRKYSRNILQHLYTWKDVGSRKSSNEYLNGWLTLLRPLVDNSSLWRGGKNDATSWKNCKIKNVIKGRVFFHGVRSKGRWWKNGLSVIL